LAHWDFAGDVLRALREAGDVSCHHYVTSVQFRDPRARQECLQLGLFIDAYLDMEANGVELPTDSVLLDLMCRRLIGVLKSDEYGNWSFASATQRTGASRLVGSELFAALSKAAGSYDRAVRTAMKGKGGGNTPGGNKGGGGGGGDWKKARRGRRRGKGGRSPSPDEGAYDGRATNGGASEWRSAAAAQNAARRK